MERAVGVGAVREGVGVRTLPPLFPLRAGQLLNEQDHLQDPVAANGSAQLTYALLICPFPCVPRSSA